MKERTDRALKPQKASSLKIALTSSIIYFVVCTAWIFVSGAVAARLSVSVEQLKAIETAKGVIFMVVTSLLFFGLAYRALRRMESSDALARASQDALMDAERRSLASLFASSIAHDMRNILTIVGVGIDDLRKSQSSGRPPSLPPEKVDQAFSELNQLSRRLLHIGREGMSQDLASTDLRDTLRAAVEFARSHPHIRECHIALHATESIVTQASPHLLQLMLFNLLLNAAEATGGKGHLRVTLHREGDRAELLVEDNGPGVPVEVQERIFTPFYTTKAGGTGLGLISVKAVVQGHDGTIDVLPSSLGGACFRIRLPVSA